MTSKRYGEVDVSIKAVDDTTVESGEFEAILSAPTLDRDGEVIDPKAFEPLPDHITIDVDHGMSVSTTVGSGTPFYDGDLLMFRGAFSSLPRAQEVRTLVQEGHIRKMSVAFRDAKYAEDDDGIPHITKAELLNAAIVPIPSNREADILAAKAAAVAEWVRRASEDLPETETTDKAAADATSPELADAPADPSVLKEWAKAKALQAEVELALVAIP